jgi:hypothetical protein
MPGVRLHHPTLRSCTYTLIHFGRPLQQPIQCPMCHQLHTHKTYHLGLDAVGDVVVSEVVFERVKEAGLDELKVLDGVAQPEPLVVDTSQQRTVHVVSREGR